MLLAWDFTVASRAHVLGGIVAMRDEALRIAAEQELGYTIDEVTADPNDNTALLVEGTFEVPSYLTDRNVFERRPDGTVRLQEETRWFPYTMVVPPQARAGERLSLVQFGHGIFGTGRRYLKGKIGERMIQPLSKQGAAVVIATDYIGLSGGDREILAQLLGDLNRMPVITDRLQQSLVNNLVLTETFLNGIQRDPRLDFGGRELVDADRVHYYGVSLGGIQGASFVALSPRVRRAFLAVPGGAWATLLTRSIVYRPFKAMVDVLYPDPLLQQTFIAMLQASFDGSDGVNLGALLFREPLPDAPRDRRVVLLEAIGDCQVPNLATRILARAIGSRQLVPGVESVFGLDPVEGPTDQPVLAQILMPERVERYAPPEENVLPDQENGTHSDAVRLEAATRQLLLLMGDGIVAHPCDGPCDPD